MNQYVLGGSFEDLECMTVCLEYWRFLCKTDGHEQNEVLTDSPMLATYVLRS